MSFLSRPGERRQRRSTVLPVLLLVALLPYADAGLAQRRGGAPSGPPRERALILFTTQARHIDRVAALRQRVERAGGRVRAILGLAGVIADIQPGSKAALAREEGVQGIYLGPVTQPPESDVAGRTAATAWNRMTEQAGARRQLNRPVPGAPPTDVADPPDLPRDPAVRRAKDAQYRQQWQDQRRTLPTQLQRTASLGCGVNGAGYYDTSLYLAGDVAVGVFYVTGTSGSWTPSLASQTFADIVSALDQFIDIQPNARLAFTYLSEVDGIGNALPPPSNERVYVNNLRSTWCTDWAYLIPVTNGGVWPNAYLHGPSTRLDRTWSPFDQVVRHETGHIFGAGDQYAGSGSYPTHRYGYLAMVHGNGCDSNSQGYFSGAGECLPDLMSGWDSTFGYNSIISPFTAGQLGWHDSNGNGVLDVSETKPVIAPTSVVHGVHPTTFTASYSGVASDRPLLDETSYGSVSINHVSGVQYRVGSASWQDAAPADGVFDSVSEGFQFTVPALPNGTHSLQIRATNSVSRTSVEYQEILVISGSPVTNTRPFGSLSVVPARARLGTMVTASGSASRDLEAGTLQFSWRWGDGPNWTPFQNAQSSTHAYSAAGVFTVEMRVRDAGGLIHLVSRIATVETYDTAPVVAFSATPENRHFTPGPSYTVNLSALGSSDAETPAAQLQVQWDADDDGVWDGAWTTAKSKTVTLASQHYPKSDWRRVRVRVRDTAGTPNITEASRFVWVVPYNHRPTLGGPTFTPSGLNFTATVTAADIDVLPWDATREYRFDLEGDGIWDTPFDPPPTITVTPAQRTTVAIEVQDRFHARAAWFAPGCNPSCT